MKKLLAWILAAVTLLAMSSVTASASRQHHGQMVSYIGAGLQAGCMREYRCRTSGSWGNCGAGRYVDADCDGLCDRCGKAHCGGHENGCNAGHCWGNFVDADNDGICDNCGYAHCDGEGSHACGNCGVAHCWGGYVDADGDGLCDNCGYIHCRFGNSCGTGSGNGNAGAGNTGNGGGHHGGGHHGGGHCR